MRAHLLQQCNNFKDPGVQHYGGSLFHTIRDVIDENFGKIPPPKPSNYQRNTVTSTSNNPPSKYSSLTSNSNTSHSRNVSNYQYQTLSSMNNYNSSGNVCFAGQCKVMMGDKTFKRVDNIQKNDIIMTPNGEAKVECIVKTNCLNQKADLVELEGGLIVTPWHPIRVNGKWCFPNTLGQVKELDCNAVYSFVLDSNHVLLINGIECIALGHGFKEEVAQHDYFGTEKVLNDLKRIGNWEDGLVELNPGSIIRDKETGLIRGLRRITIN